MSIETRRAALAACALSVAALVAQLWNGAQSVARWPIAMVIAVAFSAVLPLFYFALYRNEGALPISRSLRSVSALAALALGLSVAMDVAHWIGSRAPAASVLTPEQGGWTAGDLSLVFGSLSTAAVMVLMIAIYRYGSEEDPVGAPPSKFLRIVATVAVIGLGAWVAFNLCRLLLTPFTYATLQKVAAQTGRTPPPFLDLVAEAAGTLTSQAALFAGPYIIWRSNRLARPIAHESDSLSG